MLFAHAKKPRNPARTKKNLEFWKCAGGLETQSVHYMDLMTINITDDKADEVLLASIIRDNKEAIESVNEPAAPSYPAPSGINFHTTKLSEKDEILYDKHFSTHSSLRKQITITEEAALQKNDAFIIDANQ